MMSIKKRVYEVIANTGIGLLQRFFPEYFANESVEANERWIEFPFAIRQLPKCGPILDVGCTGSIFPHIVKAIGYTMYGVDIRPITMEGINFIQGDIRHTYFNSEYFNAVTAISTIEHIGLRGIYGNKEEDMQGDLKAVNEIWRILKVGSKFIMTVPYGDKFSRGNYHRVYDKESLARLLAKFERKEVLLKKAPKEPWDLALCVCIR